MPVHEIEELKDSIKTDYGVARHLNEMYHPKPLEILEWAEHLLTGK